MSREQQRAAAREREAARIFKTERVKRKPLERAPDVLPFRLPNGDVVQPEVKNGMKRCPRELVKALEQARRYTRGCIPIAIFSDVGGSSIACVPANDLSRWMGIQPERLGVQLVLNFGAQEDPRQVKMPFIEKKDEHHED